MVVTPVTKQIYLQLTGVLGTRDSLYDEVNVTRGGVTMLVGHCPAQRAGRSQKRGLAGCESKVSTWVTTNAPGTYSRHRHSDTIFPSIPSMFLCTFLQRLGSRFPDLEVFDVSGLR
jgi:hypothetical protein